MEIHEKILKNEANIVVVGLGYVGLPLALEFAKDVNVIGFDISEERINMMRNNIDPSNELSSEAFLDKNITFTSNIDDIKGSSFYIVAVPTPIHESYKSPNLKPLLSATETIGKVISKGDYVVFESTVYPMCTEEKCIPLIEKISNLKLNSDFKVGYSPERINPGDKVNTVRNIVKVVSGSDEESLEEIAKVYEMVIDAGVHRASSIKVAEASKIIENTQRDINIAFINELAKIFNKMGINTNEVIEAAGTKWNFLKFKAGLVGGHCISVDPYYLSSKAVSMGVNATIIDAARAVNESMGPFVANEIITKLKASNRILKTSKVLVMGAAFKENVSDFRNTKVIDIIDELEKYDIDVDWYDPLVDSKLLYREYGKGLVENIGNQYDVIVFAVPHNIFTDKYKNINSYDGLLNECKIFIDIKGKYRADNDFNYWSL